MTQYRLLEFCPRDPNKTNGSKVGRHTKNYMTYLTATIKRFTINHISAWENIHKSYRCGKGARQWEARNGPICIYNFLSSWHWILWRKDMKFPLVFVKNHNTALNWRIDYLHVLKNISAYFVSWSIVSPRILSSKIDCFAYDFNFDICFLLFLSSFYYEVNLYI